MVRNAKHIEIEHRAMFSKRKHGALARFLKAHAKDLGKNDQDIWFFVMPDKLVKVTHNITLTSGKVTLKLTKIGKGSHFEEIEFPIAEKSIASTVKLFSALGLRCLFEPKILRHNYLYKGVEAALKYSKTWGYHLELEVLVGALTEKKRAEEKIRRVAAELGVQLMSEKELRDFTGWVERMYMNPKRGSYLR
jgi:predicted adenylyl cyclase CyaB